MAYNNYNNSFKSNESGWTETKERFINPYNFVRLGKGVERTEISDGTLTGKIRCKLITKTPLAIPDAEKVEISKEHKEYPFFRVGNTPMIPGSQIRGMIRSAYETLSNSCFSVINTPILSSRSSAIRKPGIVQYYDGKFRLFEANARKYKNKNDFEQAKENIGEYDTTRVWYGQEDIKKRKYNVKNYIFECYADEVECVNLEQAIVDYNYNFSIYFKNKKNDEAITSAFNTYIFKNDIVIDLKRKDGLLYPVFYYTMPDENGNALVYLMPSQIGRTVYRNKTEDLLGSYKSCSHTFGKELCKACELFGIIKENEKYAVASKLRFSDATLSSDYKPYKNGKKIILKELASPKISSTEFYSQKPGECRYWTYDYMIKEYTGKGKNVKEDIEKCIVELNGRKYFLHNPNLSERDFVSNKGNNRNSSMELADKGNEFVFDVYFENINEKQLKELVWCLAIGDNKADSKQQYKLGHGKPLGLGSVKVLVDSVETRTFDTENFCYDVEKRNVRDFFDEIPFDDKSDYFKDFMIITNIETANKKISYPIADDCKGTTNSKAGHQWFKANKEADGRGVKWNLRYTLPRIDSNDISLPAYKYKK